MDEFDTGVADVGGDVPADPPSPTGFGELPDVGPGSDSTVRDASTDGTLADASRPADTLLEDTLLEDTLLEDTLLEDRFPEDSFLEDTFVADTSTAPDLGSATPITLTVRPKLVATRAALPAAPPPVGTYRVFAFDVGTGLSILVQGRDFTLLYDGGSNDDLRGNTKNRLLAYLFATVGASGPKACTPEGDGWAAIDRPKLPIHHLVVSHAHQDHISLLPDVLDCYAVDTLWEPGVAADTLIYKRLIQSMVDRGVPHYRTGSEVPAGRASAAAVLIPPTIDWRSFAERESCALDAAASFEVLHFATKVSDLNESSVVLGVKLGGVRLLLMGDAGSGPRASPSAPTGSVEADLLARGLSSLPADVLQVGHHGSMTASRSAFLAAVKPRFAVVSAGPKSYSGVVLPDAPVIAALAAVGATVLRTDEHDDVCPVADRVGMDDKYPGGCDAYWLEVGP